MAETGKNVNGKSKVPVFFKEQLDAAQTRIEQLEEEAQKVFKDLMVRGRASRKDLEQIVRKLSKQDWSFPEVKEKLGKLREQGQERAAEWRGKADTFRADALDKLVDLQGRAVSFLGVATREQVEELSKELEKLARRLERNEKGAKKPVKKTRAEG